ncbi:SPFH domain-containing protein [Actinoallomurus spadix]|uniref:Band 7 domain-containing protein n=1 Tax=Actinoallomurus spadix TaxID=79912 RepID=A0ABN0WTT4_9ACTN|nr:SPFH domain-containing protein [Actinoallomurus spadix]MCO5986408.1 SPFH domain-containing protein [Actinoallomurus spadix]
MAEAAFVLLGVIGFVILLVILSSIKVVQQVERGVVFRLGQVQPHFRPPGLTLIFPVIDRMTKVNMQTVAMGVPAQEGITQDNVSVRVDAVVYFRVIDPVKAIVNVQNYNWAISQVAQTSLRAVIGRADMQQLLSDRETINAELRQIMDGMTEAPWGVKIERVEIKDVSLPEGMKRSMARQAEAERERRARIIAADGEFQASKRLAAAAEVMAQDPASLQLRLLQTVVEVAAEKNSTLVMPFPVELLRFFDRAAGGDRTPPEGSHRPDLAERLAKAEEELAEAGEPVSIDSADKVPPVPGLETKEQPGIAARHEEPPAQR